MTFTNYSAMPSIDPATVAHTVDRTSPKKGS